MEHFHRPAGRTGVGNTQRASDRRRTLTKRGAVVAAVASMTALTLSALPADAAVGGARVIEVQTGTNLVILDNYPANTEVDVQVLRRGFVIGSTTKSTDGGGLLELNHVGVTDCFDGPTSPDIVPGDVIRASFPGLAQPDTSRVRGVFIDDVQFGVPAANAITLSGRVQLSGPNAVVPNTDVLELRINKDTAWAGTGRVDKREDIGPSVNANGTWSHVMTATAGDVADAQRASEIFLEWSSGGEAEASEITVAEPEGSAAEPIDCPPLQQNPTAPQLLRAQDSGQRDHVTNQSAGLTFAGLVGEPGAGSEATLVVDGQPGPIVTADANGEYSFADVTLAPRQRAYTLRVTAQGDAAGGAPFTSVARSVRIDAAAPALLLRRVGPKPLHLAGAEQLRAVYRVGERSILRAEVQQVSANGVRTVRTLRAVNVRRAGLATLGWNGRNAAGKDVKPGAYRLVTTAGDVAGNQAVDRQRFRVVR